jgi:hypothetical protein
MFGAIRKLVGLKTSPKKNSKHSWSQEQSITPEMVQEAIQQAKIPKDIKEALLSELPNFVELVDEATNKIFNPSAIWFESLQFADYVAQLAGHLREEHGPDCREEVAEKLILMAENYKELAEHAMTVIDRSHHHGA